MKPSFLAMRELAFARGRFALMGAVVALISVLMVLLSGLSEGLVNDGVSGLKRLPVTSMAFQSDVQKSSAYSRSTISRDAVESWRSHPGVAEAAPFGNTLVNGRTNSGIEVDLALFGIELGSFLDPGAARGSALSGDGQIVISPTAEDEGVRIGDTVTLEPSGLTLHVVGALQSQSTFGHVDVAYLSLRSWQQAKAGINAHDTAPPRTYREITAVAVAADLGTTLDLTAGDQAAGTTSLTMEDSFAASPGYSAEMMTLTLIKAFLYAISALVVGAFFTVVTIQRRGEIAVLRALGASSAYLVRDSLIQSFILLVVSTGIGIGVGCAFGAALATTPMPFALAATPITVAAALLITLGMLGSASAVLRLTRIDPLVALGGSR